MNIVTALIVAIFFGTGVYLLLKRDLIQLVIGVIVISNAANLYIIAAGQFRGRAPILPLNGEPASDPLVQALVLTAIVISFGVTALVLTLVYRIYTTHRSLDQADLQRAEKSEMATLEREKEPT